MYLNLDLRTLFQLALVFYLNAKFGLAQERFEPIKLSEDNLIIDGLLDEEAWHLLPTTLRWNISNTVMQTANTTESDF